MDRAPPKNGQPPPDPAKAARLAKALRDNLRRRKAPRAPEREAGSDPSDAPAVGPED